MKKIDVSAIYNKTALEPQEDKNSIQRFIQKTIHPITHIPSAITSNPSSLSIASQLDQHKRAKIFKEFQAYPLSSNVQTRHHKTIFIVPHVDDYYVSQSKENIFPNKIHRIQSIIDGYESMKSMGEEKKKEGSLEGITSGRILQPTPVKQGNNCLFWTVVLVVCLLLLGVSTANWTTIDI